MDDGVLRKCFNEISKRFCVNKLHYIEFPFLVAIAGGSLVLLPVVDHGGDGNDSARIL